MTDRSWPRDLGSFARWVEDFSGDLARHRDRTAGLLDPRAMLHVGPATLQAALEELRFHHDAAVLAEQELRAQLDELIRLTYENARHTDTLRDIDPPVGERRDSLRPVRQRQATLLNGVHVLVVDHETESRQLMVMALGRAAAMVQWASNASQALAICAPGAFDVIVSQLTMPDVHGSELLEQLRGIDPGLAAISVSARSTVDEAERALATGFDVELAKPIDTIELVDAVYEAAQLRGL